MNLLDHLNAYFGTEFESVNDFIKDFRNGELSDLHEEPEDKTMALLMFIRSASKFL